MTEEHFSKRGLNEENVVSGTKTSQTGVLPTNFYGRLRVFIRKIFRAREMGILVATVALAIALTFATPYFLTAKNLLNVARQTSLIAIIAVGVTFLLISGEIDLSVGGIFGLTGCITAIAMVNGINVWVAILLGLLAGSFFGFANGMVSTRLGIPGVIVTLGSMGIARGLALLITGGWPIHISEREVPGADLFFTVGSGRLFGTVPMSAIFMVLIFILGGILLSRTVYGIHVYATGGNPKSAILSGVNVKNTKLIAFVITGFLSALAGILGTANIESGSPLSGSGYELDVIAAVIIGGTSLAGGEGSVVGTLLGAIIMNFIRNGLVLLGVEPYTQMVVVGFIIIFAVMIDRVVNVRRT
ncbi:MAG: ABC transporter permease [Actinobacteria bacterium]|nr:ABC transporter permease [Actinomycetota bacterium]